jgi:gluconate 2-dehydrogenase gamma chain
MSAKQSEILQKIQLILFPNDGNGPSARDVNAFNYLLWVLSDDLKSQNSKDYLINGILWSDETALELYGKSFIELKEQEQEELVKAIAEENWGENWLSINLTFIFEALALDPIYRSNPDNIGWDWLEHKQGDPRPTKNTMYPNIFNTIHAE